MATFLVHSDMRYLCKHHPSASTTLCNVFIVVCIVGEVSTAIVGADVFIDHINITSIVHEYELEGEDGSSVAGLARRTSISKLGHSQQKLGSIVRTGLLRVVK